MTVNSLKWVWLIRDGLGLAHFNILTGFIKFQMEDLWKNWIAAVGMKCEEA